MRFASKPWTASNEIGRQDQGNESITDGFNMRGIMLKIHITLCDWSCVLQCQLWPKSHMCGNHAFEVASSQRNMLIKIAYIADHVGLIIPSSWCTAWLSCKQPDTQSLTQEIVWINRLKGTATLSAQADIVTYYSTVIVHRMKQTYSGP